ncbi:protein SIEVE ELEMENT OCCLUSION B-like [Gossypium australe]|uniref:Protein SIEVE ELEMENT OCCLUSION B-like n=1 Tax=Gossypium australe TaxID=47621 RepID=A0A5B6UI77_9ROSI|nr:protein SIEVE ELEMENT OCCLUSION B-like [Gossypium australe]
MACPTPVSSSSTSQQSTRNEHGTFDDAMHEQIRSTHVPDGRVVDVTPVLQVTHNVLRHIIPNINLSMNGHIDASDDQTNLSAVDGELDDALHKICCELSCKCSRGGDAHATTMAIFNMLSSYSWGAKVVLTLAAFAVNFGEFWLIAQLCTSNSLAKSVALLKQPDILEHSQILKSHFDALSKLINAMVDVTKCIVELTELPSKYISIDEPPLSTAMAHIYTATYWIISSVVVCAGQITSLKGMRHEFTTLTLEAWELSSLTHKVSSIHEHLQSQLRLCYECIDEKKLMGAFEHFKRTIETTQVDNLKILQNIFGKEEKLLNPDRAEVSINVLRKKYVLLLISDLDISQEEIRVLEVVYKERVSSGRKYEIIWLPIVDRTTWNDGYQTKFSTLQSIMSWYTVSHRVAIEPAVIKYIREEWGFVKKPIAVTLNPQGKVLCPNALNMIWIWGNSAFPFSSEKEESFWKDEPWTLDLLLARLEPNLPTWVHEYPHITLIYMCISINMLNLFLVLCCYNQVSQLKVVCFYGGVKMEWIESFTTTTKEVAKAFGIGIEMVYVGKKNARERVQKITGLIKEKQLSHAWEDDNVWFFWNLLESMLYSKTQHGRTIENDVIKQEVKTMLEYDSSKNGWALFYTGSDEMVKANGENVLSTMESFNEWEKLAKQMGFIPVLRNKLEGVIQHHHCTRLILPGNGGRIPERVQCAKCDHPMELNFLYRCGE